jgi:hypothetical protein
MIMTRIFENIILGSPEARFCVSAAIDPVSSLGNMDPVSVGPGFPWPVKRYAALQLGGYEAEVVYEKYIHSK